MSVDGRPMACILPRIVFLLDICYSSLVWEQTKSEAYHVDGSLARSCLLGHNSALGTTLLIMMM